MTSKYKRKYLREAHSNSIYHEQKVKSSKLCGCFHCQLTFEPKLISKWTDENSIKGKTAICPYCGVDSILDDKFPIADALFLKEMNQLWFQE